MPKVHFHLYCTLTLGVNYSILTDRVSCESSQPFRGTFVLRLAVCRRSSSFEDGPSTWHCAIGYIAHPLIALYWIRQILLCFYLPGYPHGLEHVRTLVFIHPLYRDSSAVILPRVLYPCVPPDIHRKYLLQKTI
jgi:hypothetical protein